MAAIRMRRGIQKLSREPFNMEASLATSSEDTRKDRKQIAELATKGLTQPSAAKQPWQFLVMGQKGVITTMQLDCTHGKQKYCNISSRTMQKNGGRIW